MGNPFITFSNRPGVGKIGASLLIAIDRGEWIATSEDEYVQKAVNLASVSYTHLTLPTNREV